jgi:hypothetical protein
MGADRRPPDVIGFSLEEAQSILEEAGWMIAETVETSPPHHPLTGPRRVVRERVDSSGRIALVVCGEHSGDVRV